MKLQQYKKQRAFTLIEIMTVIFIIAAIAVLTIPHFRRSIEKAQLAGCQSNLRNIASVVEQYRNEHEYYPENLKIMTPHYLTTVPTCPAAHIDTYSSGYVTTDDKTAYTASCKGNNHSSLGLSEDQPYFNPETGGLKP
ncbi:MAG: prepilin-type N-terminal cleavage/methylation domain-containing protein [Candidatus Eremiobacteraeota bacterium]|nr:prepilin-type N-terminal cleavage/methylation domain-containing protein [Candidatus Eremiobacteraeota bacterium]